MASRYSSNLHAGTKGNALNQGEDLEIAIADNPSYIIGQLFSFKNGRKKLIQLEQTGTPQNPQRDSIIFEMSQRNGSDMEKGSYMAITYSYLPGIGGKRWRDKFEIV